LARKYPWTGWQIALVDAVLIWLGFLNSYLLRYQIEFLRPVDDAFTAPFSPFIPYAFIFMCWILLANQGAGLYQENRERTLVNEVFKITNATSNAAVLIMALSFLFRPLLFSRLVIVQATLLTALFLSCWRLIIRMIRDHLHRRGIAVENVLLVGAGELGRHIIRTIMARPGLGYRLTGFVDDDPERGSKDIGRVKALGATNNIAEIVNTQGVDLVIVTLPWRAQWRIFEIIAECQRKNVEVRVVPDLYQFNLSQVKIEMLGGLPLLGMRGESRFKRSHLIAKRVMDIVITLIALPILIPVLLLTALAIRLESPGPILFYQTRLGFNGKPFRMIKFRSMIPEAEAMEEEFVTRTSDDPEGKIERKDDDPRITRVGRFIRRTSIDELPQLWNVLRGEMSLVGPRPALEQEIVLYKPWQLQRLMAPPGMTGLWQVSGRSDIPFEEKCLLDIYYIENWSLGLDLQILLQTAPEVLFGKGAY
jgi:exopolysaccharide biosynthesis polyprenyl glycosylphosphotransferase